MKKLLAAMLVMMLALCCLYGCGGGGEAEAPVEEEEYVEREINGTGEISLQELMESPNFSGKKWNEVTMGELEAQYGVVPNGDTVYVDLIPGGERKGIHINEFEMTSEVESREVSYKSQTFGISAGAYGVRGSASFMEGKNEERLLSSFVYESMPLPDYDGTGLSPEAEAVMLAEMDQYFPYLINHLCLSLEDVLVALGFEETDQSMLEALRAGEEYWADYTSEYGEVSCGIHPGYDEYEGDLVFDIYFEDDDAQYDYVSISWTETDNANGGFRIQLNAKDAIDELF